MPLPTTFESITRRRVFPSPDLRDFIFTTEINTDNPSSQIDCLEYGMPYQDSDRYPYHILVYVSKEETGRGNQVKCTLYWAAKRSEQWRYNMTYDGHAAGGKYRSYTRLYIELREEWTPTDGVNPLGSGGVDDIPDLYYGQEDGELNALDGFVYYGDSMRTTGMNEIDSKFIIVERKFMKICPLSGSKYNTFLNKTFPYTELLVPTAEVGDYIYNIGENPLDPNGFTEVTPVNCDWSVVRSSTVGDETIKSWYSFISYYWPPVLLSTPSFGSVVNKAGETVKYIVDYEMREAYNGPTLAKHDVWWQKDAPLAAEVEGAIDPPMMPTAIIYEGIMVNLSITSCLHPWIRFIETSGTNHPTLGYNTRTQCIDSSGAYDDWPESLVISYSAKPSNGGYEINRTTVYRPEIQESTTCP